MLSVAREVAACYGDPLRFVRFAYPWGKAGTSLANCEGPDVWQEHLLEEIGAAVRARGFNGNTPVAPLKAAIASGHGVGKSTISAWLVNWLMSTRPHSKGTVTANTRPQLATKTWASIQRWTRLCVTSSWWDVGADWIRHKDAPESWFASAQTCKEENSESFAGQHAADSSSWYLFDEACHDDQTDVLTRRGWLRFCDLSPSDDVLSMDPVTGASEYVRPTHLHVSHHTGDMIRYAARGCDFMVTPNHKLWCEHSNGRTGERTWTMREAGRMPANAAVRMLRRVDWRGPDTPTFTIPAFQALRKSFPARCVDFDLWAQFLGWYCSEGHLIKRTNSHGTTEYIGIGITNKDVTRAAELARGLGFTPNVYESGRHGCYQIHINDRALAEHLSSLGIGCLARRVHPCLRECSARQVNLFLDEFVCGDGYKKGREEVLYTSSKELADGLHELCLRGGAQSTLTKRDLVSRDSRIGGRQIVSSCDGYVVSRVRTTKSNICLLTKKLQRVHYDGPVYCAELPRHHLLFTRRNGRCFWSGNSSIPEVIWEVAEGGLTDGEPFLFAFGNPTRNDGRFHRACFGADRGRWLQHIVDSRTSRFTNKELIAEWIEDYGEDSDFVRVRVRGLPPRASDAQFIGQDLVYAAQQAKNLAVLDDEPLVVGFDVARGGGDNCVFRFRRGADARSLPAIRIPGEQSRDAMRVATVAADILGRDFDGRKVAMMFVDGTGVGGPVADRLRQLGHANVVEVQFGAASPDRHQANMRAFIWSKMRDWLPKGMIGADAQLEADLTGPGYAHDKHDRLVLEAKESMKKRGLASPDEADALALTFTMPVVGRTVSIKPPSPTPALAYGTPSLSWMG